MPTRDQKRTSDLLEAASQEMASCPQGLLWSGSFARAVGALTCLTAEPSLLLQLCNSLLICFWPKYVFPRVPGKLLPCTCLTATAAGSITQDQNQSPGLTTVPALVTAVPFRNRAGLWGVNARHLILIKWWKIFEGEWLVTQGSFLFCLSCGRLVFSSSKIVVNISSTSSACQ